jgi:hypothetical protein
MHKTHNTPSNCICCIFVTIANTSTKNCGKYDTRHYSTLQIDLSLFRRRTFILLNIYTVEEMYYSSA